MIKARREAKFKEKALEYLDLCDIAAIAKCKDEYYTELKTYFKKRIMTSEQVRKIENPRVFNVDVKEQADAAASILAGVFLQKKRLMGLR